MRLWTFDVLALSLVLSVPFSVAAQAPDAKSDLGSNAALKYWQAFALLPTLDKDLIELLGSEKIVFDAATLKVLDRSRESRVYLHRGARLPRCDWSLDYEKGLHLGLPFLTQARILAYLTTLHARYEFEHGNPRAGWDDMIALLTLARHVEVDPLVVNQYTGAIIEKFTIEALAPYLPQLKATLPEGASMALERLPAGPTLAEVILKEKQLRGEWLIRELKKAEQRRPGSWKGVWNEVFPEMFLHSSADYRKLADSVTTFEQAVKMLEDGLPWFDRLAKLTDKPWKEFDSQYPDFSRAATAESPFIGTFLPGVQSFIEGDRRVKMRRALFTAATAVVQNGPEKLKDISDPFGNVPFEYRALDRGFELRSAALDPARPVVLTVGHRKKD